MTTNSFLGADVDLAELAARTKNFSGAEIEGLVKSATSFALNRQVDVTDLSKAIDEEAIKVGGRWWWWCAGGRGQWREERGRLSLAALSAGRILHFVGSHTLCSEENLNLLPGCLAAAPPGRCRR